jgi:hypothetical protein
LIQEIFLRMEGGKPVPGWLVVGRAMRGEPQQV